MTRKPALLMAFAALALAGSLAAQTREEAKADGKAFAGEAAQKAREAASTPPDETRVPNYDPAAARNTSATAMSTASTARARRLPARRITSSRSRSPRSMRWTRRAANSIPRH